MELGEFTHQRSDSVPPSSQTQAEKAPPSSDISSELRERIKQFEKTLQTKEVSHRQQVPSPDVSSVLRERIKQLEETLQTKEETHRQQIQHLQQKSGEQMHQLTMMLEEESQRLAEARMQLGARSPAANANASEEIHDLKEMLDRSHRDAAAREEQWRLQLHTSRQENSLLEQKVHETEERCRVQLQRASAQLQVFNSHLERRAQEHGTRENQMAHWDRIAQENRMLHKQASFLQAECNRLETERKLVDWQ